jgi:hypothetical protein
MKKTSKIILWIIFFLLSMYSFIQVDRWYVHSRVPVSLPMVSYFLTMWNEGYVKVTGTIRGKDDDYYDNFNVINVECDYTSKKCTHSVGGLLDSKGSSEFQPYLNVRTETFQIVNWNKEFLIYKDIGSCYEVTFTLMRETETLTGIRKYSKKNPRCHRDDEIKYSIIDGFEYYRSESKKVQNLFLNILFSLLVFGISVYGIYRTLKPKKISE